MLAVITKVAIVLAEEGGEVAEEATNPILPDTVEMAWALPAVGQAHRTTRYSAFIADSDMRSGRWFPGIRIPGHSGGLFSGLGCWA